MKKTLLKKQMMSLFCSALRASHMYEENEKSGKAKIELKMEKFYKVCTVF